MPYQCSEFFNPHQSNPLSDLPMEFLQSLLPGAGLLRLDRYDIENGNCLTLGLTSKQVIVPCSLCGGLTQRVHSHYERTLADLPCMHFRLRLILQVCKFFCPNDKCRRRIFPERLPEVAAPWARKTARFTQRIQSIGLALGGAAGSRLGDRLGYTSSGSALLMLQLGCYPVSFFAFYSAVASPTLALYSEVSYSCRVTLSMRLSQCCLTNTI
ncbi:MAG: transposase family protein [Cyanobacteria bacterium J06621_11]